ncbi:tRNA(fMet)-specific endonuclease VapC [Streptosporangium becharense]|uniref:Ribonuclease VapC n=1 Tax=Streptosporangium becharense TaxID=1816182 RepID=A0A7W9IHX1_9ACTN|nr:PIN domain-containing protein [Streptosporangium becharense]MBB2912426.1 tRNA(fMet)-specific endonuclease VapC [Streptosporangium becharense]MBB5820745.1 tRNA(fMet)-specific endonuclease VapC [Streptosporangium becharense]
MARRLILGTGVLIAAERGKASVDTVIGDADDVAIVAITVAELLVGVETADAARRPARQAFVDEILALIPVEEYTTDVARVHARLMAHVRRDGKARGAYDLLIAATAAATARIVITMDSSAAFDDLPGVRAQVVPR